MKSLFLLFALKFCFVQVLTIQNEKDNVVDCSGGHLMTPESILDVIMANYSRSQSPLKPVPTSVEVTFQDISKLSVLSNSVTADFWFSAIWHDPRLAFSHLDPCRLNMSFDDNFEKLLWSPNVCLVNTKKTTVHKSPKSNVLLMLLANGTVWLNYRVRAEAPCEMDLSYMPMDSPKCWLVFESYSYNTATVTINWMANPVTLPDPSFLSENEYYLSHVSTKKHTEYYKAGEWYRLTAELTFKRRYGFYVMQLYLPCYTSVTLSMLGFSIDVKALPARIVLLVNSLMTATYQFGAIISSLPPVSYIKAIDVWLFSSTAFIFASLIELAVIAYQDKKLCLKTKEFKERVAQVYSDSSDNVTAGNFSKRLSTPDELEELEYQHQQIKKMTKRVLEWGAKLDRICSVAFPGAFLLFNIGYWSIVYYH